MGRVATRGGPYPKGGKPRRSRAATSRAQVQAVRPDVYQRDDRQCVVAGSRAWFDFPCSGDITIQHAVGKGSGGSIEYDAPELLRTMCGWHNTLAETNATFARLCTWFGWSVSRGRVDAKTIDPLRVPVRYPDGYDYLLGPGPARTRITREEAHELRLELYGPDLDPTTGRPA